MWQVAIPSLRRSVSCLMAHPSSAEAESHEPGLEKYRALGGNCIYLHGEGGETHSREAVGRWLNQHRLRDEFVICATICHDDWDEERKRPINRFTAPAVAQDIRTDLDLLNTSYLDLVDVGDHLTSVFEPMLEAIEKEITAGRIRGWALSNWSVERLEAAFDHAARIGLPPVSAVRTTELALARADHPLWPEYVPFADLEPAVRPAQLPVLAHVGDFNIGQILFGDEDASAYLRPEWLRRWNPARNAVHVQRVRQFANARGWTPRQVTIAGILSQPFPVVGLVGLPSLLTSRAADYRQATQVPLSDNEVAYLQG
jgi:aryl-alcohol dehydrogenase-like predicted oxidoreductase